MRFLNSSTLSHCGRVLKENHLSCCAGPLVIVFLKLSAGKGFAKMVRVWFKKLLNGSVGKDKSSENRWGPVQRSQWSPSTRH